MNGGKSYDSFETLNFFGQKFYGNIDFDSIFELEFALLDGSEYLDEWPDFFRDSMKNFFVYESKRAGETVDNQILEAISLEPLKVINFLRQRINKELEPEKVIELLEEENLTYLNVYNSAKDLLRIRELYKQFNDIKKSQNINYSHPPKEVIIIIDEIGKIFMKHRSDRARLWLYGYMKNISLYFDSIFEIMANMGVPSSIISTEFMLRGLETEQSSLYKIAHKVEPIESLFNSFQRHASSIINDRKRSEAEAAGYHSRASHH